MPLASGSSLGAYMILAPLGIGGTGQVYSAHGQAVRINMPHVFVDGRSTQSVPPPDVRDSR